MTRYPSAARALHQLQRHSSGTPNDEPPAPPTWAESLAFFTAALNFSTAQVGASIRAGMDTQRSKQETT